MAYDDFLEQEEGWIKVEPEKYKEILRYAGYNAKGVSMIPPYRGKKIWITGNLDVSNLPLTSLDGVGYVEGRLDISHTKIRDVSHIKVKGYVNDNDTPAEKIRLRRIAQQKMEEAQERRENREWDINEPLDDIGVKANALYSWLVGESSTDFRTKDDDRRFEELNARMTQLVELEKQYDEAGRDTTEIADEMSTIEDEIEEINEKFDIYHLYPMTYGPLTRFEVIGDSSIAGNEYSIGTEDEARREAEDHLDDQLRSPKDYFSEDFLSYHIDADEVASRFEDLYDEDIRNNPEVYFDSDDYELTSEQEEEKEQLEQQIEDLESDRDEFEEDSDEYNNIQETIDELQERLDSIEPDDEPTDDMISDKVEDLVNDVRRNPLSYIEDLGMDMTEFLDEDEIKDQIISDDGYGNIFGSYDGSYDEIEYDGETYVVMVMDR